MHIWLAQVMRGKKPGQWLLLAAVLLALPTALLAAGASAQDAPPARRAVMVELAAPAAATLYAAAAGDDSPAGRAAATRAAQMQLSRNDAAQRALLPRLAPFDATVLYRTQRVYNGVALLVAPEHLAALAQLPGVKAVHLLRPKTPDLAHSTIHIGAPALWQGLAGAPAVQGEGIRIGIIDTGIDYLHTAFGGPGAGYAENDRQVVGDVAAFPSVKVVGGYDFVGETYNADPLAGNYQPMPEPDPDPYDCYGHGTHVAAIAGGYGVTTAGATYTGAYSAALDPADFAIGPGVAPRALLYALKVFGCTGSSDVVDLAIEWAVDPNGDGDFADRLDVINLSLGSPYGDAYDTTAVAAANAAAAGVLVVASAGNSRDNYFIVGAPATGDGVISVAATQSFVAAGAGAGTPAGDTVASFSSRGPRRGDLALKPEIAAPGAAIVSAAAGTGAGARALSGTSMAAPHVAGALALLRQLHPTWRPVELKALAMNTSSAAITQGNGVDAPVYAPGRIGAGRIDLAAAGAATAVAFSDEQPALGGISFGAPAVHDQFTASRNVRVVNKGAAPASYQITYAAVTDLPGVTVLPPAAAITVAPGRALAFPLLLQADASQMADLRDPTVAEQQGYARAWLSEESGQLLLWPQGALLRATLIDSSGAPGANAEFTFDPATRQLTYAVTFADGRPVPAQASVALAAGGARSSASIEGARATGALLLSTPELLQLAAQGLTLHLFDDADAGGLSGRIASTAPPLHLPVYAAPRAVADLRASGPFTFPSDLATPGALTLTGSAPLTAAMSLSTLQFTSPNTLPAGAQPGEVDRYDHADLHFVGVASNLAAAGGSIGDAMVYFALTTYAPWSTPNEVQFTIYIDRNADGQADALLYPSNAERFMTNRTDNDAYVTVLHTVASGDKTVTGPLNGVDLLTLNTLPLLNSTLVLGARAAALGLSASDTDFHYWIVTASSDLLYRENMVVEETPLLYFNLRSQPYFLAGAGGGALVHALAGSGQFAVNGRLNLPAFVAAEAPPLLLLNHRSTPAHAAETVRARYLWPHQVNLPLVAR